MNASLQKWPLSLRVAFRFAFAYFLLYCVPFPLTWIPYADRTGEWVDDFWHVVVPWVAAHLLRLPHPITIFENGSGDTTYNWVQVGCFLAIAMRPRPFGRFSIANARTTTASIDGPVST